MRWATIEPLGRLAAWLGQLLHIIIAELARAAVLRETVAASCRRGVHGLRSAAARDGEGVLLLA